MGMKTSYIFLLFFFQTLMRVSAGDVVELEGHRYPERMTVQDTEWNLKGTEHYRYKVVFSVFTAAYYEQVKGKGQKLRFTYTREIKAKDLREQAMNTLKDQHDAKTIRRYAALLKEINAAYRNVDDGDAYTITVLPEKGTWLHLNNKQVFFTENADFGTWYLGIWLGKDPISDSLKEALLH